MNDNFFDISDCCDVTDVADDDDTTDDDDDDDSGTIDICSRNVRFNVSYSSYRPTKNDLDRPDMVVIFEILIDWLIDGVCVYFELFVVC